MFGVLHYVTIWYMQPLLKLFFMSVRLLAMPLTAVVRALCDPVFQAVGQVFSQVLARINVRLYSESNQGARSLFSTPSVRRKARKQTTSLSYSPEWLGYV